MDVLKDITLERTTRSLSSDGSMLVLECMMPALFIARWLSSFVVWQVTVSWNRFVLPAFLDPLIRWLSYESESPQPQLTVGLRSTPSPLSNSCVGYDTECQLWLGAEGIGRSYQASEKFLSNSDQYRGFLSRDNYWPGSEEGMTSSVAPSTSTTDERLQGLFGLRVHKVTATCSFVSGASHYHISCCKLCSCKWN